MTPNLAKTKAPLLVRPLRIRSTCMPVRHVVERLCEQYGYDTSTLLSFPIRLIPERNPFARRSRPVRTEPKPAWTEGTVNPGNASHCAPVPSWGSVRGVPNRQGCLSTPSKEEGDGQIGVRSPYHQGKGVEYSLKESGVVLDRRQSEKVRQRV